MNESLELLAHYAGLIAERSKRPAIIHAILVGNWHDQKRLADILIADYHDALKKLSQLLNTASDRYDELIIQMSRAKVLFLIVNAANYIISGVKLKPSSLTFIAPEVDKFLRINNAFRK